jgi:hypothetical protein
VKSKEVTRRCKFTRDEADKKFIGNIQLWQKKQLLRRPRW